MLIKTPVNNSIIEFLKKDYIINLNILGVLENVPEAEIYVDNVNNPAGVLVKKNAYMHYLYSKDDDFINEVADEYLKTGFYGFSGVEASVAEKIMGKHVVCWESPVTVYYMPEENLDKDLIKNPLRPIDIKDAEEVDKYYKYSSRDSLEAIKKDILDRPSSAVYIDNEMACWVLVHEDDSMGIMYTKEEHRRKGYAVDVTVDLASKIMEEGKIPFIQIVKDNGMSPGLAQKCGFIEYGHAKWFGVISGTPEYLINCDIEIKKLFLSIASEDMEKVFYNPEYKYKGMFLAMYNFDSNFTKNENFELIRAVDSNMLSKWCDTVTKIYEMNKENGDIFKQKILTEMSKEKSSIIPLLGLRNGNSVSVSALIELEDETYGVCCLGTVDKDISLLELTLNETLAASQQNDSFLVFIQCPEDNVEMLERIGFRSLTMNCQVTD
jgi:hypothetical protein